MHCLGSASRERRLCQPRATALPRLSTMGATLSGRCPDAVRTLSALRGVYRTGVCAHGHARAEVWRTQSNAVCAWKKRHLRFLALLYSISTNDEHVSFYY